MNCQRKKIFIEDSIKKKHQKAVKRLIQKKKFNKSKKELSAREVSHLALVLEHPAFQSKPFATIQEHLKNTLADQAKEVEAEGKTKALEKEKLAAKRKRVKKARQREDGGKHRKKFRATRTRSGK